MPPRDRHSPQAGEPQSDGFELIDNGGMRLGGERRQATGGFEGTERRTGADRRRGSDRRSGIDRRSRQLFRDGEFVERRDALRRPSDEE